MLYRRAFNLDQIKIKLTQNKLIKVVPKLNFYLTPPIFVGTQWLKHQLAKNEKILTNGQLLVKFVNILSYGNCEIRDSPLYNRDMQLPQLMYVTIMNYGMNNYTSKLGFQNLLLVIQTHTHRRTDTYLP